MQDIVPPPKAPEERKPKLPMPRVAEPSPSKKADSPQSPALSQQHKNMTEQAKNNSDKHSVGGVVKPALFRRLMTAFFACLTLTSAVLIGAVLWLQIFRTEDSFASAMAPLATDTIIRDKTIDSITERILDVKPPRELAMILLPEATVPADDAAARSEVEKFVKEQVTAAVSSPAFTQAIREGSKSIYRTLTTASGVTAVVDMNPAAEQLLTSFEGTKLGALVTDNKDLVLAKDLSAEIDVSDTKSPFNIAQAFRMLQKAARTLQILIATTILLFIITILISPYRFRTARRLTFGIAVQYLFLALMIWIFVDRMLPKFIEADQAETGMVVARLLTANLQRVSLIVGAGALLTWFTLFIIKQVKRTT